MLTQLMNIVAEQQKSLCGLQGQLKDANERLPKPRVVCPAVPVRGDGFNISRIKTKDLVVQMYDPSLRIPIEPFLASFESAITALERRADCTWDDQACYSQLLASLGDGLALFVANENLLSASDKT